MPQEYPRSTELLMERLMLSNGAQPVIAFKFNGQLPNLNDEGLLGAADILRFPDKPPYAYIATMLHLFPGEQGETEGQAHNRIKGVADELVGGLSKLAAGEMLDAETVELIDDTLTRARQYLREDECRGFGKVTIQYAAE